MQDEKEVEPFRTGELVGQRYRIDNLIGEDALGFTYQVSELGPRSAVSGAGPHAATAGQSTPLALRLLRPPLGADGGMLSPNAQQAWRRQLLMLRDLHHPGIVPVYDVCLGDERGRVYIVRAAVELVGQPLSVVLYARPGGLPEPEAVRLCASIAEAVEAAHLHASGILHLGLSPQRIFVVPSGETIHIKVADFALLPPSLAQRYGEPGYLAPEQIEGQPCDRRTDQFSLAVIFYEMLSGQPAFIGAPDEDRAIILHRVLNEDPLPLALSRPIELALARALSRSRSVRFPSLSEFICALGVDGVAWTAVRPPGLLRSQYSPPPRRTPLYIPVLLGALSAVTLLGVYTRFFQGPRSPKTVQIRTQTPDLAPSPVVAAVAPSPPDLSADSPPPPAIPPAVVVAARPTRPMPPQPPKPSLRTPGTAAGPASPDSPAITSAPAPTPPAPAASPVVDIQITTNGPPLSPHHVERIKYCLRLISIRPPFSAVLESFRGTLLVSLRTQSAVIRESSDFRDCLKNEIRDTMDAKDVYLKGIIKGKSSP